MRLQWRSCQHKNARLSMCFTTYYWLAVASAVRHWLPVAYRVSSNWYNDAAPAAAAAQG